MSRGVNRLVGKKIADRYCITGEIGVGGMGRVFKAMPFEDPSRDVAIKVIQRSRQLNSEDLLRFQKEAALMSRLHHPNIICFHELGLLRHRSDEQGIPLGHGYYIVMEMANGTNLKDSLIKDGRKDLAFFFQIALCVSDALDYTHGKNIIHRDIKPQNIVVGKAIGERGGLMVKVLDFGVARLAEAMHFTSEGGHKKAFQDIAGTPLYMAPEQTPLMDAPIDHRVDLYSLGCVLYEVLTGRPPFTATTRDKLERQHVFDTPEPLTNLRPDIPPIVAKVVHKLLAKRPDDRYQSAFALRSDLLRCKKRLEAKERPASINFSLGLNDLFQSVSAKLKLIGREGEFSALIAGYEATLKEKGRSRLSVVRGEAGMGKTRLLAEFRNYLAKRRIRFISANFSQHENALPFNALANGFNDFLIRVLKGQPHEADELKRKIKTLLGPTVYQVAAVVPGLKPFIAEDIPRPSEQDEDDSIDDFQTFAKAFSDFTRCLAIENQPVVFIFDDLHWADEKSLDLIDQFFSHNNSQRFYMVVSHRTNDLTVSARFQAFVEKFRKLRRRFSEIYLRAFAELDIRNVAATMFGSSDVVSPELTTYLEKYSQGNPLQLVELIRSLVQRDKIHRASKSTTWNYDIAEIESAPPHFDSVDLVLSRIQRLANFDRKVLEVASVVGMGFQIELLKQEGRLDTAKLLKALNRAEADGLVVKLPENSEELGASFSFTHWRARDVIYRNIDSSRLKTLHEQIAEKLSALVAKPDAKAIFSLAHHFNCAVDGKKAREMSLAQKCIEANIAAGEEAKLAGSWLSAQRYFENVYLQMGFWPTSNTIKQRMVSVVENLGDLAALQKRHGVALKRYKELSSLSLDRIAKSSVAFKSAGLLLVGGLVSKSIATIKEKLLHVDLPVPTGNYLDFIRVSLSVLVDLLPLPKEHHPLFKTLKSAYSRAKSGAGTRLETDPERLYSGIKLYKLAETAYLNHTPEMSLYYHQYLLSAARRGAASPGTTIRSVGDRAALLAYLGHFKPAYNYMDLAMDASRVIHDRSTYGYLCLMRALSLDYLRDKGDEFSANLKSALKYLSPDSDRILYAQAIELKMFRELLKGKIDSVVNYSKIVPENIPTRSWLSARSMAIFFYANMLADARDTIVEKGELYLKRRESVKAREDDLFIQMIQTLVTFARGEIDKTRKCFIRVVGDYIKGNSHRFLYPFEEDFVALFTYSFPILFEQEHGRRLMRDKEMAFLLKRLGKRVRATRGGARGLHTLILARSAEVLGKDNVKKYYDDALKAAKINSDHLTKLFTYIWFGDYLIKSGGKTKTEYLRRAQRSAGDMKMFALAKFAEKRLERWGLGFEKKYSKQDQQEETQTGRYRSGLVYEHLEHICAVGKIDTAIEQNLEESIAILSRNYQAKRVFCIMGNEENGELSVFHPFDYDKGEGDQVIRYVEPYFSVRSALFLPAHDAPWFTNSFGFSETSKTAELGRTQIDAANSELDQTIAIAPTQEDSLQSTDGGTIVSDGAALTIARSGRGGTAPGDSSHLQMSALIPIRGSERSYGLLYLEDVDLTGKETTAARAELDVFGAQLGVLIETKASAEDSVHRYRQGEYMIEELDWLKVWTHGRLRAGRETTWYTGLNYGPDHYLISYCRLNGPQQIRDDISSFIWHQLLAHRFLAVSSGRNDFEIGEIREELASLLEYYQSSRRLDAISISFSLFDRDKKVAHSGHFGPSRPIVLYQNNVVVPENDIVMTLENGRDLRYWLVNAPMVGPHAYILPHDSSKLDAAASDSSQKDLISNLLHSTANKHLNRVIEQIVMRENLPRYYVACILKAEEDLGDTIEVLDEAQ